MLKLSPKKKEVIALVRAMSEEEVSRLRDYIFLQNVGYDENEPPLTEDEIEGLKLAEQDIAEGRIVPFDHTKDL